MNIPKCEQKQQTQQYIQPEKMITFLDSLHRKYKVLSKLSEKQLQDFQNQVIYLLVDENQNVDPNAYADVMESIGIDAFVLEILSKCLNRSPFANTYELKKNISSIASDMEKQTKQLTKKAKILERKQAQLNKNEGNLKNRIKQYVLQLQRQHINKLVVRQNEIKKNLSNLMNGLKLKEKIINERREEIVKKLNQINMKQKSLLALQKQQKQQESKKKNLPTTPPAQLTNATQSSSTNNINICANKTLRELKQMTKKYEDTKEQLERLKKKYKTTEMAYNKLKNDINEKQKQSKELMEKLEEVKQKNKMERQKFAQQLAAAQKQKALKVSQQGQNESGDNFEIKAKNKVKKMNPKNKGQDTKNRNNNKNGNELIDMLQMLQISHIEPQIEGKQTSKIVQPQTKIKQQQKFTKSSFKQFINAKKKQFNSNTSNNIRNNIIIVENRNNKNVQLNQDSENSQEEQREFKNQPTKYGSNKVNLSKQSSKIEASNNYFTFKRRKQHQEQQNEQQSEQDSKESQKQQINTKNAKNSESHIYRQQQQPYQLTESENGQQSEVHIPNFLTNAKQHSSNKPQDALNQQSAVSLISQIQAILQSSSLSKSILSLFQSNLLLKFIQLSSFQFNKQILIKFFDILLSLIQQSSPHYYQSIQYLSQPQFTAMFQKSYLNYETNMQISEATTLLLSRILMVTQVQVKFTPQFINAIKLRIKAMTNEKEQDEDDDENELLKANINCLLSMIYV